MGGLQDTTVRPRSQLEGLNPSASFSGYGQASAILGAIVGLVGMLGVVSGQVQLARVNPDYVPIAPSSAIAVIALSFVLFLLIHFKNAAWTRFLAAALAAFVLLIAVGGLLSSLTPSSFDLERFLFRYNKIEAGVQLGHMSPIAATGFILIALGIVILLSARTRPHWLKASPVMGLLAILAGLVGVLGYAYGSPLLYGSSVRPIALEATVSLVFLGVSLMCAVGPGYWPAKSLTGPLVKARLLRTFVPITVIIVLVMGWIYSEAFQSTGNPAIVASLIALVSAAIVVVGVSRLAQRVGGDVDRSTLELRRAEQSLRSLNEELKMNSNALSSLNKELEAFAYSVSHDLRAPLRHVDGFASLLLEEYSAKLDDRGKDYLNRMRASAQKMATLIDDLLKLSRAAKGEIHVEPVDISSMVRRIADQLQADAPTRKAEFAIAKDVWARGDPQLLEVALENLLGNAWKFTSKNPISRIEFGRMAADGTTVHFVRDNGVGFDATHADRLFAPFSRLHSQEEFPGNGIGLATVRRIIAKHGGEAWAEGIVGVGATFYFTIGQGRPTPDAPLQ